MMVQAMGRAEPPSDYERIERNRRRRKLAIVLAMGAVGGIGGGIVGAREDGHLFDLAHPWPPLLCLALAALFLLAVGIGTLLMRRQIDEVERMTKLRATHVGAMLLLVGYPVWFLLWKGGFLPEPQHVAIYAAFLIVSLLASLYYKFR
jgi:drug/metabolite transporter (DMT)-like permease